MVSIALDRLMLGPLLILMIRDDGRTSRTLLSFVASAYFKSLQYSFRLLFDE